MAGFFADFAAAVLRTLEDYRGRLGRDKDTVSKERKFGLAAMGLFLFFGRGHGGTCWNDIDVAGNGARSCLGAKSGGIQAIGAFMVLRAALVTAGVGWSQRRLWGWWLAAAIIAAQVVGNVVNLVLGRFVEGAAGIALAGVLLFYLLRP